MKEPRSVTLSVSPGIAETKSSLFSFPDCDSSEGNSHIHTHTSAKALGKQGTWRKAPRKEKITHFCVWLYMRVLFYQKIKI